MECGAPHVLGAELRAVSAVVDMVIHVGPDRAHDQLDVQLRAAVLVLGIHKELHVLPSLILQHDPRGDRHVVFLHSGRRVDDPWRAVEVAVGLRELHAVLWRPNLEEATSRVLDRELLWVRPGRGGRRRRGRRRRRRAREWRRGRRRTLWRRGRWAWRRSRRPWLRLPFAPRGHAVGVPGYFLAARRAVLCADVLGEADVIFALFPIGTDGALLTIPLQVSVSAVLVYRRCDAFVRVVAICMAVRHLVVDVEAHLRRAVGVVAVRDPHPQRVQAKLQLVGGQYRNQSRGGVNPEEAAGARLARARRLKEGPSRVPGELIMICHHPSKDRDGQIALGYLYRDAAAVGVIGRNMELHTGAAAVWVPLEVVDRHRNHRPCNNPGGVVGNGEGDQGLDPEPSPRSVVGVIQSHPPFPSAVPAREVGQAGVRPAVDVGKNAVERQEV
mmetsp:Transcript_2870/g.6714  ORF Transcript_2870/g.6714 Transcript_2870/m.6714 type:complete len:442 (-) Transcript_2870:841-2166(-)